MLRTSTQDCNNDIDNSKVYIYDNNYIYYSFTELDT